MRYLLLAIIVIPALEIGILISVGRLMGVLPTVLLIIATGVAGAYLAKKQGLEVIRKVQDDLREGYMPGDSLLDGICILAGGIMLLTPGLLTDLAGLLLLLPFTRKAAKAKIYRYLKRKMERGNIIIIK